MATSAGAKLQLTLAIIKPDVTPMIYSVLKIREMIIERGFFVVKTGKVRIAEERAKDFYREHEGRFFYNRLVTFMSSGESQVHVLAKRDAIADWRSLMGPTKVYRTRFEHPATVRGLFGLTDTRNCCHGSDSDVSARREIDFFFPSFDVGKWFESEEELFRLGKVNLDAKNFVHRP